MSAPQTLPEAILAQARRRPSAVAIRHRRRGAWHEITWHTLATTIAELASGLREAGGAGAPVVVCGRQHPVSIAFDLAVQTGGGWTVALPPVLTARQAATAIAAAGARIAFCGDARLAAELGALPAAERPGLELVVVADGTAVAAGELATVTVAELRRPVPPQPSEGGSREDRAFVISAEERDGGEPHTVAWSHGDVLDALDELRGSGLVAGDGEVLCHFPLAHPLGRLLGAYAPLLAGASLTFAETTASLIDDMVTRSPTSVVTTPRLLELLKARHEVRLARSGRGRRALAGRALASLESRPEARGPRRALAMLVAGRAVRRQMGLARTRTIVALLEPISPEVVRFFAALGVQVVVPDGRAASGPLSLRPEGTDEAALLESALRASPYIARAVVADTPGGRRRALVELELETAAAWAQAADVPHTSHRSLAEHPATVALFGGEVAARGMPAEHVVLLPRALELNRGELTWLGMPRRGAVTAAFLTATTEAQERSR